MLTKLRSSFFGGVGKGWSSFVWISKIIVPISFLVTLLQWIGWLEYLDILLAPLMNLINLPPEAGLPIVTGMLLGTYSVIAIITVIPFTIDQMTLIAIFTLISHALIMEGIIQHKSGLHFIKATIIRIIGAVVGVLIVSQFLGDTSQSIALQPDLVVYTPLMDLLYIWIWDMAGLLIKIFVIIMFVMIILQSVKTMGWIEYSLKVFRPPMRILGLSDRTAIMCVAALVFGLMYGGTLIVEESKEGNLTKEELERLHISIGINHAMIEDPALFVVLGLPALLMWVPRLIIAIIAVQIYRGIRFITASLSAETTP